MRKSAKLPPKMRKDYSKSEKPKVSIVIRTKNEEKWLGKLLEKLSQQTFKDFEIIIVDNDSTDKTLEIAKKFKVNRIISIPNKEFSHPSSINLGIKNSAGKFVVLTNGHCIPMSNTWLEDGLKNFEDQKVAAIDGHYTIGPEGRLWQRIADRGYAPQMKLRLENRHVSTTNAIIRKDLWEKYYFDETLSECEDYDWSKEMIARGYKIIKDPKFNVFHYHPLTITQFLKRQFKWRHLCNLINKRKRPR